MIDLTHYLMLGAVMFCIGLYGLLTRKSAVSLYMCIELMFNAANINLVAFSRYIVPQSALGQVFSLFVIAISAAEFGVGIAIIILMFRRMRRTDADTASRMGG